MAAMNEGRRRSQPISHLATREASVQGGLHPFVSGLFQAEQYSSRRRHAREIHWSWRSTRLPINVVARTSPAMTTPLEHRSLIKAGGMRHVDRTTSSWNAAR